MARFPRIVHNAASLLVSDLVNRAATFTLYIMIARYLGLFQLGQVSLAFTFFYIGQVVAAAGLKTLITREVARDKARTYEYVFNGGLIVLGASMLSMLGIQLVLWAMQYSAETSSIILLLSAALLPFSFSALCEGAFQAHEEMRFIAFATVPVNLLKMVGVFLLLRQGEPVNHVLVLVIAAHVAVASVEWWLLSRKLPPSAVRVDLALVRGILRSTWAFLGLDAVIALFGSVEILLLSRFATEAEVGTFSAAVQMLLPVTLLIQNVVASVFPIMCRRFRSADQSLRRIVEELVGLLIAFALPVAICIYCLAEWLLSLIYGDRLQAAAVPLRILVWGLVLRAVTTALGQLLLASQRERITLRIVTVDALTSLTVGLVLIPHFGVVGAAASALTTRVVDVLQHVIPVKRVLAGLSLSQFGRNAVIASACMGLFLIVATGQGQPAMVLSAGVLYVGVVLVLTIWSSGGLNQLATEAQAWSDQRG